jgi:site-specific recombinase XerC
MLRLYGGGVELPRRPVGPVTQNSRLVLFVQGKGDEEKDAACAGGRAETAIREWLSFRVVKPERSQSVRSQPGQRLSRRSCVTS